MKILRILKLGFTYKIILLPSREESSNHQKNTNSNNFKLLNNIIRAKTNIHNLILCNNLPYFFTQTLSTKYDRTDFNFLRKSLNNKIRYLRKEFGLDLEYIFIAEKHKDNISWHIHGLLSEDFSKFFKVNKNDNISINEFEFLGFNSVSRVKDNNKVANYILKYITKDFFKLHKGKHCYFCSRGLKRPEIIFQKIACENELSYKFDYDSEYCQIKYNANITDILHFTNNIDITKSIK